MRDNAPRESAERHLADTPSPRLDRATSRRLFREMTKMQIEDGPLPWARRRDLVRFARRLGIDTFEAKLIIRAVEYECGLAAPAALDERESPAEGRLVMPADESLGGLAVTLIPPVAILLLIMLAWAAMSAV
ncbi:MAG TPA: hypothetical protein P5081_09900 [Phycisphaerae bacterium]|nr:hypothetical protein [Phycisphaerae bacterium]HRW53190.1 hypothetical protein [Phycisphaerae bacterium]